MSDERIFEGDTAEMAVPDRNRASREVAVAPGTGGVAVTSAIPGEVPPIENRRVVLVDEFGYAAEWETTQARREPSDPLSMGV